MIYLADRNFIDFEFLRAVIDIGSDFVVRMKTGQNTANVAVAAANALTARDVDAGVLGDQIVTLPGSRWTADCPMLLRLVTVLDPVRQEATAHHPPGRAGRSDRAALSSALGHRVVFPLAQMRRQGQAPVERVDNGITLQFYTVIIATLLMYLHTGQRPSIYSFVLLSSAASGDLLLERVPEILDESPANASWNDCAG